MSLMISINQIKSFIFRNEKYNVKEGVVINLTNLVKLINENFI